MSGMDVPLMNRFLVAAVCGFVLIACGARQVESTSQPIPSCGQVVILGTGEPEGWQLETVALATRWFKRSAICKASSAILSVEVSNVDSAISGLRESNSVVVLLAPIGASMTAPLSKLSAAGVPVIAPYNTVSDEAGFASLAAIGYDLAQHGAVAATWMIQIGITDVQVVVTAASLENKMLKRVVKQFYAAARRGGVRVLPVVLDSGFARSMVSGSSGVGNSRGGLFVVTSHDERASVIESVRARSGALPIVTVLDRASYDGEWFDGLFLVRMVSNFGTAARERSFRRAYRRAVGRPEDHRAGALFRSVLIALSAVDLADMERRRARVKDVYVSLLQLPMEGVIRGRSNGKMMTVAVPVPIPALP